MNTSTITSVNAPKNWISDVSEQALEFDQKVENFVKKYPLAVMLCAIGVGYLTSQVVEYSSSKTSRRSE